MKRITSFRSIALLPFLFMVSLSAVQAQKSAVDPAGAGFSPQRLERLSAFLEQEIKNAAIPGAVSLIMRKGKIAHSKAYGLMDLKSGKPMREDAVFFIQSMTKPIISVGLMVLYEEGHFDLNDPISRYLPEFREPKVLTVSIDSLSGQTKRQLIPARRPITIAQVLSHTAGMLHGLGNSELDQQYVDSLYRKPHADISSRVKSLAHLPLIDQPGAAWHYSASPDVLARLIEHFSGKPVEQFLKERLFDPLGMNDTGYNLAPEKSSRMTGLHYIDPDKKLNYSPQQTPQQGNTVHGGTHGLFSTAQDYLKFCQMLLNKGEFNGKRILGRKTVELMTADYVKAKYREPGYGFGFGFAVRTDLADAARLGSVGQFAWSGAYNTYFFIDPKEQMIGLLMLQFAPYTNYYNYKFQQLVYQAIAD